MSKNAYGSADEMLADENIDIVYIATPHNSHYEFLMKALQSGKTRSLLKRQLQ